MNDTTVDTNQTTDNKQQSEQSEWQKRECGALWAKQSASQEYFSGHITVTDESGNETKQNVVIFSNKHKKKPTHPDWRIYKSEPMQGGASPTGLVAQARTTAAVEEVEVVEEELI